MSAVLPRIVVVSGSVRRPSRSKLLGDSVAAAALKHVDAQVESVDLIDAGAGLGAAFTRDALTQQARRVVEAIETADALIAISPVYKGSYAGLFKHLFDFIEPQNLAGKPVVVGATGGGHRHGLVVEHQLRPLFGFFSALTVPTAVYASDHEFADGKVVDQGVALRVEQAGAQLAAFLNARRTANPSLGLGMSTAA